MKTEPNKKLHFDDVQDELAKKTGITKALSKEIVCAVVEILEENLLEGNSISIYGFGELCIDTIAGFDSRDWYGNAIHVNERKYVRFKPSRILAGRIKYDDPTLLYNWKNGKYYHAGDENDPSK